MREPYADRAARNDSSRNHADNFRAEWTKDDIDFLMTFFDEAKGDPALEAEVAEALGRTIEACRQRFYEVRSGIKPRERHVVVRTTTTTTSTHYIGINDDPDDQWWSPDYYK